MSNRKRNFTQQDWYNPATWFFQKSIPPPKFDGISQDLNFSSGPDFFGKKTSERIVIELSDKITSLNPIPSSLPIQLDAIAALITLGYKEKEAVKSVELAIKKIKINSSLADLISLSLSGSQ